MQLASFLRCSLITLFVSIAPTQKVHAEQVLNGVGSSAAYPVYKAWAEQYARATGVQINYDPAGSSAGLKKIRARESDFGASDLVPSDEDKKRNDLIVLPTVITGVVPVFNLPKISSGQLVVDGDLLATIFSGGIKYWNDPMIQRLNPKLTLPAIRIIPVVRSDGSGTTYNFSDYLAKINPQWQQQMGVGTSLKWPEGVAAAKGSKGVALSVQEREGSIGYVDYNYAVEYELSTARMRLADGSLVEAKPNSFRNALMQSSWLKTGDFTQTLTNQPGRGVWPITMGTFIIMPRIAPNSERAKGVIRFFTWAFMNGDQLANQINFIRLPDLIQAKAFRALAEIRDSNGTAIGVGELGYRLASHP